MEFIKQFGLQRTGTNVTRALIEVNFRDTMVLPTTLGSKHYPASWEGMAEALNHPLNDADYLSAQDTAELRELVASRNLKIILNMKDPISWLESYYRYAYRKARAKDRNTKMALDKAFCRVQLRRWEQTVSSWQVLMEEARHSLVVLHSDILSRPEEVLRNVEAAFMLTDLRTGAEYISHFEEYARAGGEQDRGVELLSKDKKFDPEYHTENKWKEKFRPRVLEYSIELCRLIAERNPSLAKYMILDF